MVPIASVLAERLRSRLWPIPAAAAVTAGVAAALLATVRPDTDDGPVWWPGEPASARGLLEVLAGSSLTVVALVFSLQVVALQLAASQYSPRLLRTYARDGWIQGSLAVLLSTFVFSLVTLALFGAVDRPPRASVAVAVVLGLASVGALVGVVAHIVSSLRVETMMAEIHADAEAVVDAAYGPTVGPEPDHWPPQGGSGAEPGRVLAERPGFVQAVDRNRVAAWADENDCYVRVAVMPGTHVRVGDTLAYLWPGDADGDAVTHAVLVGFERTPDEDPAFGLVQLVDIAMRALSPSVNDPTTAVHAIGHLASLLATIAERAAGPVRRTDVDDAVRVLEPVPQVDDLMGDVVRPLARSSGEHVPVMLALLDLLDHVSSRAPTTAAVVAGQAGYVARRAEATLADAADRAEVLQRAARLTTGTAINES